MAQAGPEKAVRLALLGSRMALMPGFYQQRMGDAN